MPCVTRKRIPTATTRAQRVAVSNKSRRRGDLQLRANVDTLSLTIKEKQRSNLKGALFTKSEIVRMKIKIKLQIEDFTLGISTTWYIHLCQRAKPWTFRQQELQWTQSGTSCTYYQRGIRQKVKKETKTSFTKRRPTTEQFTSPHGWTCATSNIRNWPELSEHLQNIERQGSLARRWRYRRHRSLCSIHQTRSIRVSYDSRQSTGHYFPGMSGEGHYPLFRIHSGQGEWCLQMLELPDTECPTIRIRNRRPKHWENIDDAMVPLERNLRGHPLAGLLWERRLQEVLFQEGWKKDPAGNVSIIADKLNSFYQCMWTT